MYPPPNKATSSSRLGAVVRRTLTNTTSLSKLDLPSSYSFVSDEHRWHHNRTPLRVPPRLLPKQLMLVKSLFLTLDILLDANDNMTTLLLS